VLRDNTNNGIHLTFAVYSLTSLHTCSNVAGATIEGEDLSLFYGNVSKLTTTTPSQKFLQDDIYAHLVRDCVICCVDILLVRISAEGTKQCLLVERASDPVKGVWWLPGGRLLKGETFFDAGTL
jgi:hypothetical protein